MATGKKRKSAKPASSSAVDYSHADEGALAEFTNDLKRYNRTERNRFKQTR